MHIVRSDHMAGSSALELYKEYLDENDWQYLEPKFLAGHCGVYSTIHPNGHLAKGSKAHGPGDVCRCLPSMAMAMAMAIAVGYDFVCIALCRKVWAEHWHMGQIELAFLDPCPFECRILHHMLIPQVYGFQNRNCHNWW